MMVKNYYRKKKSDEALRANSIDEKIVGDISGI